MTNYLRTRKLTRNQLVDMFKSLSEKSINALLQLNAATTPNKGQVELNGQTGKALYTRGLAEMVFGLGFRPGRKQAKPLTAYRITKRGFALLEMIGCV